jgi:glycosyltransferase involved in cell wall biosynthesis
MISDPLSSVGAVAIGKDEGERLKVCLRSLAGQAPHLVYVDSGSSDGSVEFARLIGANVVELDSSIPFTAARGRNAGIQRLRELAPEVEYAQLIDGDCELEQGWIRHAVSFLDANPEYAAAAGRLKERPTRVFTITSAMLNGTRPLATRTHAVASR